MQTIRDIRTCLAAGRDVTRVTKTTAGGSKKLYDKIQARREAKKKKQEEDFAAGEAERDTDSSAELSEEQTEEEDGSLWVSWESPKTGKTKVMRITLPRESDIEDLRTWFVEVKGIGDDPSDLSVHTTSSPHDDVGNALSPGTPLVGFFIPPAGECKDGQCDSMPLKVVREE